MRQCDLLWHDGVLGFLRLSGIVAPPRGVGGPRGAVCDAGYLARETIPQCATGVGGRPGRPAATQGGFHGRDAHGVLLVGLALTLSLATAAAAQPLSGPENIASPPPAGRSTCALTGTPIVANMPTTIQISG